MLWHYCYAKNWYNIIKIYQKRKEILREMKKGCRNMYKVYDARVISSFYICISRENASKNVFDKQKYNFIIEVERRA